MSAVTKLINDWAYAAESVLQIPDFVILGAVAFLLVSLICGSVGAMVIGNRLAFFSDALAHCAFAGVALGIITAILRGGQDAEEALDWVLPLVMVGSGVLFGLAIAFVREKTTLATDTVIGVFFASAIGLGAVLFGALRLISNKNAETYLFGSLYYISAASLVWLAGLGALTAVVLGLRYNQLVFASFNPSLARSRRIPVRLYNYLLIVLLALIVNISIQAVGILLINAMIVVPAAAAVNVSRNLRQMYWWTILLSLAAGVGGIFASYNLGIPLRGQTYRPGTSGCIVLLSVLFFALSMLAGPRLRRQPV